MTIVRLLMPARRPDLSASPLPFAWASTPRRLAAVLVVVTALLAPASHAVAQTPVTASADHAAMLAHPDPRLAANKRLVYDFWREVFEAARMDLAEKYMLESYIQHNPNVPDGRAAFVSFFSRIRQPKPIEPRVAAPLVAILADGDLVTLVFVRELPEPSDATKKYTTTWFDMFRLQDGKVAEHWDPAVKR